MSDSNSDQLSQAKKRYWKANLIVISVLLAIWFVASCCCGIIFIEQLNEFSVGNLPLGFWMANQGSMLIFKTDGNRATIERNLLHLKNYLNMLYGRS